MAKPQKRSTYVICRYIYIELASLISLVVPWGLLTKTNLAVNDDDDDDQDLVILSRWERKIANQN